MSTNPPIPLNADTYENTTDQYEKLIDILIEETSDEAVFQFISAISAFGIINREDAIAVADKDKDVRAWLELTVSVIPRPYG